MSSTQPPDVSIIICTRNRAEYLQETLASLGRVNVPPGWSVELIVVDNGSTDHTVEVVKTAELPEVDVRILSENEPGVSRAQNKGVKHATGDVLLFTDDDMRFPVNWMEGMAEPIRNGQADAVAGGVVLAPYLQRPWQKIDPWLTSPLATTDGIDPDDPQRLVGANMALSKRVFEEIPCFDTELGRGAKLGTGEETLLTHQVRESGMKIVSAFDVQVEHHCSERRLARSSYLMAVKEIGRSQGHIDYHWKQTDAGVVSLLLELLRDYAKLWVGRILRYEETRRAEGLPGWEMSLLTQIHHRQQLLMERGRVPKYEWMKSSNGNGQEHHAA